MLRLPPFRYLQPRGLDEAVGLLAGTANGGDGVRLVAGGTDLWPNMKRRHQRAETVISLLGIPELARWDLEDGLRAGATVRLAALEHDPDLRRRYPALATAIASISSPPLRNMGTLGGNVCVDTRCTYYNQTEEWRRAINFCMKAEGEVCWVAPGSPRCWAHTASDTAPMLCALGARVHLRGIEGERSLPIEELYVNDGMAPLSRRADEILTGIEVPAAAGAEHCRSAFWKLRRRGSIDFAVLSVACALWCEEDGTVREARIFLGAVSSAPVAATAAVEALVGRRLDATVIAEAAALSRKAARPMDMADYTPHWRSAVVARYAEAALRQAAGLEPGLATPRHPRF